MRPSSRYVRPVILLLLLGCSIAAATAASRELTFEERVTAQRAIERVYFSHLEGTRRTFEQAVTQEVLERKVRTSLQQSALLEAQWHNPITAAMLAAEGDRIARSTQFPERLAEIEAALGHDTFLIQETLVRATLAERLTRNFFVYDPVIHEAAQAEAEGISQQLAAGTLDPAVPHPRRIVQDIVEGVTPGGADGGTAPRTPRMQQVEGVTGDAPAIPGLAPGPTAPRPHPEQLGIVLEEAGAFTIRVHLASGSTEFVVYSVPKIPWDAWWPSRRAEMEDASVPAVAGSWSGFAASRLAAGLACEPDGWDNGLLDDVPDPRYGQSAVWTGTEMIVWGGEMHSSSPTNASRYDPLTDTWRSLNMTGAPQQGIGATAIWTGSEMIVWRGGSASGRYDPSTDSWRAVSSQGQPFFQFHHTAVWTGREMIIWGGFTFTPGVFQGLTNQGAAYAPDTDTWRPLASTDAPMPRVRHTAVWTGSQMIVFGGDNFDSGSGRTFFAHAARYDVATDTWMTVSVVGVPTPRVEHSAVWSGDLMIIWGGLEGSGANPRIAAGGARYNPLSDSWSGISAAPVSPRRAHAAIWADDRMIVSGGTNDPRSYRPVAALSLLVGEYDPITDNWKILPEVPVSLSLGTAIWTGVQMITWGGRFGDYPLPNGYRFATMTQAWTPVSRSVAVDSDCSSVWTGTEWILWSRGEGGASSGTPGGGGRYDPMLDNWRATSHIGAPDVRWGHLAVWTGDEMVIWGGYNPYDNFNHFTSGGRYDPVTDSWRETSNVGVPGPRVAPRGVWTGQEIILWGGSPVPQGVPLGMPSPMGARYDPVADQWAPVSEDHELLLPLATSVVWTGREMIAWGGAMRSCIRIAGQQICGVAVSAAGARYDPVQDRWQALPALPASEARNAHQASWTGRRMIVTGGSTLGPDPWSYGWEYDRASDAWSPLPWPGPDTPGFGHSAVWTGHHLLLFGTAGSMYDDELGAWSAISPARSPAPRSFHQAAWTGSSMLVWGGSDGYPIFSNGGRYFFHQTVDDDGDGLSECDGDCDDASASTYPQAEESCNARDDSCNGLVDEGTGGVDSDGDGSADACDACSGFPNPGQSDLLVCASANQDGGECLETSVVLNAPLEEGEVTLVRHFEEVPDLLQFETNADSCDFVDPVEFLLNGEVIATFAEHEPLCICGTYWRIRVSDRNLVERTWRVGEPNVFGIRVPARVDEWRGTYVGLVRVTIGSGTEAEARSVCLYDAGGEECLDTDMCSGYNWNLDALNESVPVDAPYFVEQALRRSPFQDSTLPRSIDLSGITDDPMRLCVGEAGPARMYAANGGTGLWTVGGDGRAESAGSLPMAVAELAHDELGRETWSQADVGGNPTMVKVHLLTGDEAGVSPFLASESSGLEVVNGLLYSIEAATDTARLLEIEPENGSYRVASYLGEGRWYGLEYDFMTGGFLSVRHFGANATIHRIDPATGAITPLTTELAFIPTDLERGPDGMLYATRDLGSDTELHRVDLATGTTTLIGRMGVGGITTLATVRNLPRGCLDLVKQGEQTLAINGSCSSSSPPTALAGPDITAECVSHSGGLVHLNGSASTDPDNDITGYRWLAHAGTPGETAIATGATADVTLPLGSHVLTLEVSDSAGATSEDTVKVSVVDTQPPSLTVTADPPVLWPPNHRMVPVLVDAAAQDACDPSPTSYLISLVSSEPDDAPGHDDGQTGGDAGEPGEGDVIPLRAERSGDGPGRLYTLTWKAKDGSGNSTTASAGVLVPHDLHGVSEPIDVTLSSDALEWTAVAGALSYNVLRAPLSGLTSVGSFTLVHDAVCAGRAVTSPRLAGPILNETPAPGQIFGYLVESFDGRLSGYGTARGMGEIVVASGDGCQ